MSNLFDADQKYKSLSIVLLGLSALGRIVTIFRLLMSLPSYNNSLFQLFILNLFGNFAFCLAPPVLLLCYLLFNTRKEALARSSLILIAAGGLFCLLWPVLNLLILSTIEKICFPIGPYLLSCVPSFLINVSILIVAPIVLFETSKGIKKFLPRICLVEALLWLVYGCYILDICNKEYFVYNIIYVLEMSMLWGALFVMTKYDLVLFTTSIKNAKIISATEELRELKVLFETNQVSEDEYSRRKAAVLNFK